MAPLVRRCWAPPRPYPSAHAARPFAAQGLGDRCLGDLAAAPPATRVLRVSARCQLRTANRFLPSSGNCVARCAHRCELLWDRLRARRGEPIASWQVRHRARVRIHLLPPYAPELNPVELIWGHVKDNDLANCAPYELADLLDQTPRWRSSLWAMTNRSCAPSLPTVPFFTPEKGHYLYRSH